MKNILIIAVAFFLTIGCNSQKTTTSTDQGKAQQGRAQQGRTQKGGRPNVAELMAQMDANKDGKLSKSEVSGPLQNDFSKIDLNNDGFITKIELENAPKPERGQRPPRN